MSEARYAVGIDLGTTHCVMAAVDLSVEEPDGLAQWTVPVPPPLQAGRAAWQ